MPEALRTYLELAVGVTEASRKKVRKAVKEVLGRGNATAEQVKSLAEDLIAANSANREALVKLVRFEVDRTLGVVGLATAEEVAELTNRVRDLERQLHEAQVRLAAIPPEPVLPGPPPAVAMKAAKTAVAKTAVAKKAVAKKAVAKKAGASKAVAAEVAL